MAFLEIFSALFELPTTAGSSDTLAFEMASMLS